MSRLLGKRVRIGKYVVPALLLLSLAVGTVAGAIYVLLTWSMSLTVLTNPRVHFKNWSTGAAANTFTEGLNIFPSITTVQEKATYALYSQSAGLANMRIATIDTADVADVYVRVFNATDLVTIRYTVDGTNFKATPFSTAATTWYTIRIEVTATSGAVAPSSGVTLEVKVESP